MQTKVLRISAISFNSQYFRSAEHHRLAEDSCLRNGSKSLPPSLPGRIHHHRLNKMASEIFGTLVATICLNLILYSLEVFLAFQFQASKSEDDTRKTAKFGVWLTVLIDTAATVTGCAFLYMFQGSHWGEDDGVQSRYWRIIVGVLIAGTVSTVMAQSFLLERFWKNIRHHLLGTAFAVTILVMAIFVSVAAVVVCAYLQWTNASILTPFLWASLICNVIAALGITTVSVCQRCAMKTLTPKKHIVTRAWRAFIETGFSSSIIAILALVAWAIDEKGEFIIGLYFIQARVYTCTMLFALRNPPPPRTDGWIQDMLESSIPQKSQPTPPLSPDIFLKNEKDKRRLSDIPEEKAPHGWYNIDLGNDNDLNPRSSYDSEEVPPDAMVLHRNAAFYQVPTEGKR
ncbi:hypothetical protein MVEN_00254100 [Mycena venus]|uniref:Uncharacterized protein n=1 Tax=Mycena venus TaxID=2733690 RepID=A0A8H7DBE2_9AGAR|nr:hypothetical protein MVEN_00254100 [Mycena venus]